MEEITFITEWPPPEMTEEESAENSLKKRSCDSNHNEDRDNDIKKLRFSLEENGAPSGYYPYADVALASWWRRSSKSYSLGASLPCSNCPSTIISFVSRTQEGRDFLKKYVESLDEKRRNCPLSTDLANILAAMGSVWERLGKYDLARKCLKESLLLFPQSKENLWIFERIKRQIIVIQKQDEMLANIPQPGDLPKSLDVHRVDASKLSVEDFYKLYCARSVPVIITGLNDITRTPWDLNHIGQIAGDRKVVPKRYVAHSVEWAKLENCNEVTVCEFIQSLDEVGASQYLFDWSLPLHCPELAAEINIPEYFTNNYIQGTQDGSMYKDSWPSLFVSPANVSSKLHIDTNGTHFWMFLFQGHKRWTVFQPDDAPCLYPTYYNSLDPVFEVDVHNMNLETHPLLAATHPQTFDLKSGEVLFVPAGCPHEVVNLEVSIAISGNFINQTNFATALKELEVNSLVDERAEDLLKQLKCKYVE